MGTGEQGYEDQPAHEVQTCCTGELGYGTRMDELYANTPSLSCIKLAMLYAAQKGKGRKLMTLDVKGAFLCGAALRKIYIELPSADPQHESDKVGLLRKAILVSDDARCSRPCVSTTQKRFCW